VTKVQSKSIRFFKANRAVNAQSSNETLHSLGYQVISQAIKIDSRILSHAKKTVAQNAGHIFNHNESNKRNDFKRRQKNLPVKSNYMKAFDSQVKEILKQNIHTDLIPSRPVVIHSRPGCQAQAAHCDYIPDEALKKVNDTQMPLAALVCLMKGSRLNLWPNSHHLATTNPSELMDKEQIPCQEIQLNEGDIVVFRGDFIHAGSAYSDDNYRVHYYLDSPLIPRVANRTWLIEHSGNDALIEIIKPMESEEITGSVGLGMKDS
jgi:ectoine hydroxylase-related dioxygenase (phytanoyl-CoA dioxygenase family)